MWRKKEDKNTGGYKEIPEKSPPYIVTVIDRLRIFQVVKQKGRISNDITITEHIQGWKNQT